jgi:hypothetical protein
MWMQGLYPRWKTRTYVLSLQKYLNWTNLPLLRRRPTSRKKRPTSRRKKRRNTMRRKRRRKARSINRFNKLNINKTTRSLSKKIRLFRLCLKIGMLVLDNLKYI